MHRFSLLFLCFVIVLSGCAYGDNAEVGGRIVLWHDDDNATRIALDDLVERFMEINPDINVSMVAVPADEMLSRYTSAAELSLGPDLFIGDSTWIRELADGDLIQPIDTYEPPLDQYLSTAMENVRYDGDVYGIPYALSPTALYYNADMVTAPPETLTDLLTQAADGLGTAMTTQFDRAFWGVRAFGGSPFDTEGRVSLDRGGFASWLTWINTAQNASGMFLNNDRATLINLFTSERAAYYVGTPEDLPQLRTAMGEDANIQVTSLPSGPGGTAGPLLHLETFLFNAASAPRNTRAALALARFLTNDENSLRLAREINYIPANLRVPGIDAQTYPIVNSFMTQARTALPISNTDAMFAVLRDGGRLYRQVLDGVIDPTLAATQFTETINVELGIAGETQQVDRCTERGDLRLWHSWQGDDLTALTEIMDRFVARCPNVEMIATQFGEEDELIASYRALYDSNIKPDIILLSDTWVYALASDGLIQPIVGDTAQQFVPAALNALTYQGSIYGTPISLSLTVLFLNRDLAPDPPRTLEDLRTEAAEGRGVAVSTEFEAAYWGISTFGGALFDAELNLALNQNDAMVSWLSWLSESAALPGFIINTRSGMDAFSAGEVAYFIGSSHLLPNLVETLDAETVAIAPLPAGPGGEASPLLRTNALMVNTFLEEERTSLIQEFTSFATNVDNQQTLFNRSGRFPANVNIENDDLPALAAIQPQLALTTVYPNVPQLAPVLLLGDGVYRSVLNGEATPQDAVTAFIVRVDEINNPPEATPEVTPESTPETTPETAD